MALTVLGKVASAIYGEIEPADTSFLWGKQLDAAGNPNLIQFLYHDGASWLPLRGSDHFRDPVISQVSTPPVSPSNNDRHLVSASGLTGAFIGHENEIATWNSAGSNWDFTSVSAGNYLYKADDDAYVLFNGTLWRTQSKTTEDYFDVAGGTGAKLKAVGGGLELRDLADTGYIPLTVESLTINGPNGFWNDGSDTTLGGTQNIILTQGNNTSRMQWLGTSLVLEVEDDPSGDNARVEVLPSGARIIYNSILLGSVFGQADATGFMISDTLDANGAFYGADFSINGILNHGNRWISDIGYQKAHIGDQLVDALITTPTVTEDGYVISWNNTNQEYELIAGGGGGGWAVTGTTVVTNPEIDINNGTVKFSTDDGNPSKIILESSGVPGFGETFSPPDIQWLIPYDQFSAFESSYSIGASPGASFGAPKLVVTGTDNTTTTTEQAIAEFSSLASGSRGHFGVYLNNTGVAGGYSFMAGQGLSDNNYVHFHVPSGYTPNPTGTFSDKWITIHGGYQGEPNDSIINFKSHGIIADSAQHALFYFDQANLTLGGIQMRRNATENGSRFDFSVRREVDITATPLYTLDGEKFLLKSFQFNTAGEHFASNIEWDSHYNVGAINYFGKTTLKHSIAADTTGDPTLTLSMEAATGGEIGLMGFDLPNGAYYISDNSGTQTKGNRWIPDKEYVDSQIAIGGWKPTGTTVVTAPEIDISGTSVNFGGFGINSSHDGDFILGLIGTPGGFESYKSPRLVFEAKYDILSVGTDYIYLSNEVNFDTFEGSQFKIKGTHKGINEHDLLIIQRNSATDSTFHVVSDTLMMFETMRSSSTRTASFFAPSKTITTPSGFAGISIYGGADLNQNAINIIGRGIGTTTDSHTFQSNLYDSNNIWRGYLGLRSTQGLLDSYVHIGTMDDGDLSPGVSYRFRKTQFELIEPNAAGDGLFLSPNMVFSSTAKISSVLYQGFARFKHTVTNDVNATPTLKVSLEAVAGGEIDVASFYTDRVQSEVPLSLAEVTAPLTDNAGYGKLYLGTDKNLYLRDDGGIITNLGGGGTNNWKSSGTTSVTSPILDLNNTVVSFNMTEGDTIGELALTTDTRTGSGFSPSPYLSYKASDKLFSTLNVEFRTRVEDVYVGSNNAILLTQASNATSPTWFNHSANFKSTANIGSVWFKNNDVNDFGVIISSNPNSSTQSSIMINGGSFGYSDNAGVLIFNEPASFFGGIQDTGVSTEAMSANLSAVDGIGVSNEIRAAVEAGSPAGVTTGEIAFWIHDGTVTSGTNIGWQRKAEFTTTDFKFLGWFSQSFTGGVNENTTYNPPELRFNARRNQTNPTFVETDFRAKWQTTSSGVGTMVFTIDDDGVAEETIISISRGALVLGTSSGLLGFYGASGAIQAAALTAENGSVVDSVYGTEERDVIQNLVTRVAELETALANVGLTA